ncbi:hypothetical protein CkaCkLH20_13181 [Colletotrichum karsti]|uniref:Uncharacterized protein n=1 Tax=Colletotrichum karsti TaxID=1095194 RepID=A0A9P6HS70_9PEZI|nr:uncharacterized protein CkaCkLH20_13181 [Colletotrichum karsti]KAF9869343.1 hypothetical protein CkaCkLH20_13181 [Colletotrichum karsti]
MDKLTSTPVTVMKTTRTERRPFTANEARRQADYVMVTMINSFKANILQMANFTNSQRSRKALCGGLEKGVPKPFQMLARVLRSCNMHDIAANGLQRSFLMVRLSQRNEELQDLTDTQGGIDLVSQFEGDGDTPPPTSPRWSQ